MLVGLSSFGGSIIDFYWWKCRETIHPAKVLWVFHAEQTVQCGTHYGETIWHVHMFFLLRCEKTRIYVAGEDRSNCHLSQQVLILTPTWNRTHRDHTILGPNSDFLAKNLPANLRLWRHWYLSIFPERRVEGRFLGAVSLSSMTSLAWFKLLNLNLLDLTCLTWTCLTKTFLISLSWLDLGKLLTWLAKPTCFTWLAKLTCLTDLFNWLALLTCFTDLLYWLSLLDLLNWLALLTFFTDLLYWLSLLDLLYLRTLLKLLKKRTLLNTLLK